MPVPFTIEIKGGQNDGRRFDIPSDELHQNLRLGVEASTLLTGSKHEYDEYRFAGFWTSDGVRVFELIS